MKVFITVWDRFSWLIPLAKDFSAAGLEVILIDNKSTYPPLLEWYKTCPYEVIWMDDNYGPWAFFTTDLYKKFTDRYFMISDSDYDISKVPKDFVKVLMTGLEESKERVWKSGLGFEINDLPENQYTGYIIQHESRFWKRSQLTQKGYYRCYIDLGIAIYDRSRRGDDPIKESKNGSWYDAVHAPAPYVTRHLDWYLTKENIRKEDIYYLENVPAHYGWAWKWYNEIYKNGTINV